MEETLENLFDDDDLGLGEFDSDKEDDTIEKPAEAGREVGGSQVRNGSAADVLPERASFDQA